MSEIIQNETVETIDTNTRSNCNTDKISTIDETSEQDAYQDKSPPLSGPNTDRDVSNEFPGQSDDQENPSSSGLDLDKDALEESFVELDCPEIPSSSGQIVDENLFDEIMEQDEYIEMASSSGLNADIRQELRTEFTIAEYLDMCYDGTYQGFEQAILKIVQAFARCTDDEFDSLVEATEHMLQRTEEEYVILIIDKLHTVFQNCLKKGPDHLKSVNERLIHNAVICCLNILFEEQFLTNEVLQNVVLPCLLEFLHGRPRYQSSSVPDYYYIKNRPTVGQIVVKCADLLDPRTVDEDVVPIFEELICDDSDIHFTILQNMALVFKSVSTEKRAYLLTKLNSFLRIESSKGWRLREEFADQCLMMCSSCSLSQINQYIICFALSFMDDRFDCVRQKAILLLSEILSTFVSCEWPTSPDTDMDDLDSLLRKMPLSKATIHDIYGSFAHSTLWRRRQAFATLLIHVLQNGKSRIKYFGRLFGNDLVGIAKDRLPNIRLKFLSLWRCLHIDEEEEDSFDELFPELRVKLKEALEDMAAGDPDFEVQTQARIALNLVQPQKDSLDYGDHYRRLAARENRLWERLDEYKEEYERRMKKVDDNPSESTALFIESYVQEDRPKTSSVKTIASNIQALFNNRRSPQTHKTPNKGRGGFKFVVSSVPENERSPPTYKPSPNRSPETERRQIGIDTDDPIDFQYSVPSIAEIEQSPSALNQSPELEQKEKSHEKKQSPVICERYLDHSLDTEQREKGSEFLSELPESESLSVTNDVVPSLKNEATDKSLDALISDEEQSSPSLNDFSEPEEERKSSELLKPENTPVIEGILPISEENEKPVDVSVCENEQSLPVLNHVQETEQERKNLELSESGSTPAIDNTPFEAVDNAGDGFPDVRAVISSLPEDEECPSVYEPSSDHSPRPEQSHKGPELSKQEINSVVDNVVLESTEESENYLDAPLDPVSEKEQSPTLDHSAEKEQRKISPGIDSNDVLCLVSESNQCSSHGSPEVEENRKNPELYGENSTVAVAIVLPESTSKENNESLDVQSSVPENEQCLSTCESSLGHLPVAEEKQHSSELSGPESILAANNVLESMDEKHNKPLDALVSPVPEKGQSSSTLNHFSETEQKLKSLELPKSPESKSSSAADDVALKSTSEESDESLDAQSPPINSDSYPESDCSTE